MVRDEPVDARVDEDLSLVPSPGRPDVDVAAGLMRLDDQVDLLEFGGYPLFVFGFLGGKKGVSRSIVSGGWTAS